MFIKKYLKSLVKNRTGADLEIGSIYIESLNDERLVFTAFHYTKTGPQRIAATLKATGELSLTVL